MTASSLGDLPHPTGVDGVHHQRQRLLQAAIPQLLWNTGEPVEPKAHHQVVLGTDDGRAREPAVRIWEGTALRLDIDFVVGQSLMASPQPCTQQVTNQLAQFRSGRQEGEVLQIAQLRVVADLEQLVGCVHINVAESLTGDGVDDVQAKCVALVGIHGA